ncbi:hypothetical protein GGR88_002613 [Sphingomonas jejuensis]|uniref:TonB C-terminal domain-containing protein n=1 Tax=Sphingomonas jejuensis TaxID=904715 RepID=A0ABX0XNZ3_9SPHN|nr:hypothetical protein [Sphingomonas jejuensis]NJC35099.1 hypothetical protein [Sphingomonas jejuensis]
MAIALSVLLLLQAAPATDREPPTIVIQARRAEEDLAACLARNCPPDEEIEAALDAAVQQFADGRYVDAKRVLGRTVARHRGHATENPRLFASLLATSATVAEHEGDDDLFRQRVYERTNLLRTELGPESLEAIMADLDTGNMLMKLGSPITAEASYRRAEEAALAAGRPRLAAAAMFRQAWLELSRGRYNRAESLASRAGEVAGADNVLVAELGRILAVRIAYAKGDEAESSRLLAALPGRTRPAPLLITAPPIPPLNSPSQWVRPAEGMNAFVDVGFWVRPDGRVEEVEVLRDNGRRAWFNPVVNRVADRRYAPFPSGEGDPGIYQIERYTLRPSYEVPYFSRISRRIGSYHLKVASLTHMAEETGESVDSALQ